MGQLNTHPEPSSYDDPQHLCFLPKERVANGFNRWETLSPGQRYALLRDYSALSKHEMVASYPYLTVDATFAIGLFNWRNLTPDQRMQLVREYNGLDAKQMYTNYLPPDARFLAHFVKWQYELSHLSGPHQTETVDLFLSMRQDERQRVLVCLDNNFRRYLDALMFYVQQSNSQ